VNDLNRLNEVIEVLEEQSSQVNEFNGVLSELKRAKESIDSSKNELQLLYSEQKLLVKESYEKFDEFGTRIEQLEKTLSKITHAQDKVLRTVCDLQVLSPKAFEQGIVETRREVSELLGHQSSELGSSIEAQNADIKSLQNTMRIGIAALVAGIGLLAVIVLL
jgi:SMC interacting uncharacterized protein involved in chromosome segregation